MRGSLVFFGPGISIRRIGDTTQTSAPVTDTADEIPESAEREDPIRGRPSRVGRGGDPR